MQTIISFYTAEQPDFGPWQTDNAAYRRLQAWSKVHHKTHILRGKWLPEKAIARAKRYGAVAGTIRVSHAEIFAAKEWQRFDDLIATA